MQHVLFTADLSIKLVLVRTYSPTVELDMNRDRGTSTSSFFKSSYRCQVPRLCTPETRALSMGAWTGVIISESNLKGLRARSLPILEVFYAICSRRLDST